MNTVPCPKCGKNMDIYKGNIQGIIHGNITEKKDMLALICEKCDYRESYIRMS